MPSTRRVTEWQMALVLLVLTMLALGGLTAATWYGEDLRATQLRLERELTVRDSLEAWIDSVRRGRLRQVWYGRDSVIGFWLAPRGQ